MPQKRAWLGHVTCSCDVWGNCAGRRVQLPASLVARDSVRTSSWRLRDGGRCSRTMEHSFLKFLLLVSLCSAFGSALQCYVCETEEDALCKTQTCITGQNACLNVTFHTNQFFRRCWYKSKCNIKDVQSEFNIESGLSLSCCSWDLCNSKSGVASGAPVHSLLGLLSTFASLHLFCFRS